MFIICLLSKGVAGLFPISAHSLAERHGEVMEKLWKNVEDSPPGKQP
jgi:hypothetical protein